MKEIITCNCGDNATGTFDISTGVLTISGTGNIPYVGWRDYINDIKSVVIEDGITNIVDCAFYNCKSLISINISDSVTSIGNCAFYNCKSLISINISDNVTSIGNFAFCNCTNLISIIIPNSFILIGNCAFIDSGLQTIYGKSGSYAEVFANAYDIDFVALDNNIEFYVCNEDYSFFINSYALIYLYRNIDVYYSFFRDCIIQEVDDFGSAVRSPLKSSIDVNIDKNLVEIERKAFLSAIGSKNFI